MYQMTYSSLLEDVRRYLERGFTADSDSQVYEQLPHLVTLAERRIARELKLLGFVRAVTAPLDAGDSTLLKPSRWRDTISMRLPTGPLFGRSYEFCRAYWPDATVQDTPRFYADYDYSHWLFVPTPAANVTVEILYYEQPQFLGDDVQSNWITDYAPDALLYATLLESMPFLKNDERIATWQTMYDRSIASLSSEDLKRITDRTASRTEV